LEAEQEEEAEAAAIALENGDDGMDNAPGGIFFPEID
jgi:hypothetical protein